MPRKDLYHDIFAAALEKAGWRITDDPLHLAFGGQDLYVDLGAQRLLGPPKGSVEIAVEVKSFVGKSAINDLQNAVGQYNIYRDVLAEGQSDRPLYLAVPMRTYKHVFLNQFGRIITQRQRLLLVIFQEKEGGLEWLPDPETIFEKSFAE